MTSNNVKKYIFKIDNTLFEIISVYCKNYHSISLSHNKYNSIMILKRVVAN